MLKKFESIPATKLADTKDEKGNDIKVEMGLCLRYRPKFKKWVCGYGSHEGALTENQLKYRGAGDTPKEAIDSFIKILEKENV